MVHRVDTANEYRQAYALGAAEFPLVLEGRFVGRLFLCGHAGAEGFFRKLELPPPARIPKTIIAHLDKALGQNVREKSLNERLGAERFELPFVLDCFVAKGDLALLEF